MIYYNVALQPPLPQDVWQAWNWDLLLILGLLATGLLYVRGIFRLWQRAGDGRAVSYGQALAFAAGWLALFVALVSPLDALGSALLAAHMVQHLTLTLLAAPLLVLGAPPVALAWGLPHSRKLARWWHKRVALRRAWRLLSRPTVAWAIHLVILWLWHLPALYQAALLDERVHILEHTSFLGAALLFWWTIVPRRLRRPRNLRRSLGPGPLYTFTTALLSGLLGVLLTFSQRVWYPSYGVLPYGWGLTPLQDQQLAGVIMWFPGGLVYLAATLVLLGTALRRPRRARGVQGKDGAVVAPQRPLKMQS